MDNEDEGKVQAEEGWLDEYYEMGSFLIAFNCYIKCIKLFFAGKLEWSQEFQQGAVTWSQWILKNRYQITKVCNLLLLIYHSILTLCCSYSLSRTLPSPTIWSWILTRWSTLACTKLISHINKIVKNFVIDNDLIMNINKLVFIGACNFLYFA